MNKIVIGVMLILSLNLVYFSKPILTSAAPPTETGKILITLPTPTSIDDLMTVLKSGEYEEASAQSSFTTNGRTITDFMTILPEQSVTDVKDNWIKARQSTIAQLQKDGFFEKSTTDAVNTDIVNVQNFKLHGNKQSISSIGLHFDGAVMVYYSDQEIKDAKIVTKTSKSTRSVYPIDDSMVQAAATANVPYYTLVPVGGSVNTGLYNDPATGNSTRGVLNYMRWNNNNFSSDQTYEHDFFLKNDSSSPGTYFARSFSLTPYCLPKAVYAATSWPASSYPYLDSDLEGNGSCSSTGNIAYSIGAAQANAITTGVDHFTQILMPNGDASTDKFLLQGQVGYQFPTGSHSTLNSFAYGYNSGYPETTHYGIISGSVPSGMSWPFIGFVPDTPVKVVASLITPTVSTIRLDFTDITWDETAVLVERSVAGGTWTSYNFGVLNAGYSAGNWSWTQTGLTSKTKYCYRMRTRNAIGYSPYSPTTCVTTL
ncbi:MAG: hypothetical protein RLZZ230_135 [Candidatus Parcubacteria bacterium]|jgi:hypothetical protein